MTSWVWVMVQERTALTTQSTPNKKKTTLGVFSPIRMPMIGGATIPPPRCQSPPHATPVARKDVG